MTFQEETWSHFIEDAKFIFPMHWRELALNQEEIPMDMDYTCYGNAFLNSRLSVITARNEGELLGYLLAWVVVHPHYKSSGLMASVDMFYIIPPHRKGGTGAKLLLFAEEALKARGVGKVSISCKVHMDHSKLFEKMGWTNTDLVFSKLLRSSK